MVTSKEVYDRSVYCCRSLILHSDLKASLTGKQHHLQVLGLHRYSQPRCKGPERNRERVFLVFVCFKQPGDVGKEGFSEV